MRFSARASQDPAHTEGQRPPPTPLVPAFTVPAVPPF
jgi:hypothetical protein